MMQLVSNIHSCNWRPISINACKHPGILFWHLHELKLIYANQYAYKSVLSAIIIPYSWHYATSRKVVGSIPDEIIDFSIDLILQAAL
jgi:hypothetical protein